MQLISILFAVVAVTFAHSEKSILKTAKVHRQPDIAKHADEAGKVVSETVADAGKAVTEAGASLTGDGDHAHHGPHSEIGEGAYQSAAAVMERTTDKRTNCEDGKWNDCFKSDGDYVDHYAPHKEEKPFLKSGAPGQQVVGLSLAVVAVLNNV